MPEQDNEPLLATYSQTSRRGSTRGERVAAVALWCRWWKQWRFARLRQQWPGRTRAQSQWKAVNCAIRCCSEIFRPVQTATCFPPAPQGPPLLPPLPACPSPRRSTVRRRVVPRGRVRCPALASALFRDFRPVQIATLASHQRHRDHHCCPLSPHAPPHVDPRFVGE